MTDYSVTIPAGWALQYGHLFNKHLLMTLDGITNVYILDLPGGRQVFVAAVRGVTTDPQKAELRGVLDSIRIPG